jgi:hypothetical protein
VSIAGERFAEGIDPGDEEESANDQQREERLMALYSAGLMRTASKFLRPVSGKQAGGWTRSTTTRRVSNSQGLFVSDMADRG